MKMSWSRLVDTGLPRGTPSVQSWYCARTVQVRVIIQPHTLTVGGPHRL